jgi:hypothetical protein
MILLKTDRLINTAAGVWSGGWLVILMYVDGGCWRRQEFFQFIEQ